MAGFSKLRGPLAFRAVLRQLVPGTVARFLGGAVPTAELAVAGTLLSGYAPATGAGLAIALLIGFAIVLVEMARGGATMDCGCFGEAPEAASPVSGIIRNLGLLGLAALIVASPERAVPWHVALDHAVAAATVAAAAICLWLTVSTLAIRRELLLPKWRPR
jgi:hypothetical protein